MRCVIFPIIQPLGFHMLFIPHPAIIHYFPIIWTHILPKTSQVPITMTIWGLHPSVLGPIIRRNIIEINDNFSGKLCSLIDLCPLAGSLVDIIIGGCGQSGSERHGDFQGSCRQKIGESNRIIVN